MYIYATLSPEIGFELEMPSKAKKHSKTVSRLSNFGQSLSPGAPSLISSTDLEIHEQDLILSLEQASTRFPFMIGKFAFIGRVTDVVSELRGCKIWLSESSMVAFSLSPGSIVSALRDEVRLSSNLYYTMGCPDSGRTDGLLVIAATNRPDSVEPALRRPGRLDREIEIGVPSPKQRLDILNTLLTQMEHSLSEMQVQNLAMATHGFVGADLASLCNEAALVCLRRCKVQKVVILEIPKVNWEDVGGQREVKAQLMEAVEWPRRHQDAFLLIVKGPELFSKWVGESEKAVKSLFTKARANAPSIIFFDEIDGLAVIRGKENGVSVSDRVMTQLLVEMDGRFDRLLYVGPSNETDREDIFRIHLRKIPCSSDISIKELAHLTEGCTGADISFICREAAIAAIEECVDASEVTMQHLKTAITQVQPSQVQSYEDLSAKFQRLVHSNHGHDELQMQDSSVDQSGFPSEIAENLVLTSLRDGNGFIWEMPILDS
ncbi:hypothetical protein GH714_018469 [Hevea brasiliensis]|uniref:AAA+ ATPase domain-containing protein n=1 Tax=Hevea brasiliensis TaxID=3981 RepID=A0A6A6KPT0_HEVBR|nr:hypothetical protein GH714_018469 [Hevea brasiliensis]